MAELREEGCCASTFPILIPVLPSQEKRGVRYSAAGQQEAVDLFHLLEQPVGMKTSSEI